jgi:hypothetical protein
MPFTHLCAYCGQSYRTKRSKSSYCSPACDYAARRKRQITSVCMMCGRQYVDSLSHAKRRRYCSRPCEFSAKRIPRSHVWEKLWSLVAICEHGRDCPFCCWPWLGTLHNGYGTININGKNVRAHRCTWESWHQQSMPPHLFGAHYCHRRDCVSPSHVHPATQKDNIADSMRDHRWPSGYDRWESRLKSIATRESLLAAHRAFVSQEIAAVGLD